VAAPAVQVGLAAIAEARESAIGQADRTASAAGISSAPVRETAADLAAEAGGIQRIPSSREQQPRRFEHGIAWRGRREPWRWRPFRRRRTAQVTA
jgi:hypothetical protein